jgi:hypothetical protein
MSQKNKVEWNERLRDQLVSEFLKKASSHEELAECGPLLLQILNQTFDALNLTEVDESRLYLVLQSYRGVRGGEGQAIHPKVINLAQRIAPHLPGERFWFVAPTQVRGVRFESDVAHVEIILNEDIGDSPNAKDD